MATTDHSPAKTTLSVTRRRAIAYSLDCLIPGLYGWFGPFYFRLGGSLPEPEYPGVIHSYAGLAVVLPGYRIYSTYQGSYSSS